MNTRHNAALVLEGGAMRTLYTAGVLDIFMENGLEFDYTIGTSSGSLAGVNFVSRQPGRTAHITVNYCRDPHYISLRNRFRYDGVFNIDFLFQEAGSRWDPLDINAYLGTRHRFVVVATSCLTGEPVYFEKPDPDDLPACLKASCAIPLLARIIGTPLGPCLDGGVADSIPFRRPLAEGYEKIVVVRTRDRHYRKKPSSRAAEALYKTAFAKHPAFLRALGRRPALYNAQVEEIHALAEQGKAFVVEPQQPVTIARAERNPAKLRRLYDQGRAEAEFLLPGLRGYMAA